jgi:hypothetical protein
LSGRAITNVVSSGYLIANDLGADSPNDICIAVIRMKDNEIAIV